MKNSKTKNKGRHYYDKGKYCVFEPGNLKSVQA